MYSICYIDQSSELPVSVVSLSLSLTYLDEVGFVAERKLEGAVALGETESAGLVVTLQVMLHCLTMVALNQQQDKPGPCHQSVNINR